VSSESYLDTASDVVLEPGARSIVHISMIHARAPLGLRIMPEFFAVFPGRTDTPFGVWNQTIALALFHDLLRIRTLRFGLEVAWTPRTLNSVATGVIGTWCPDKTTWQRIAWCPVSFVASYGFGGTEGPFESGIARARGVTALEMHRGAGFIRAGIGLTLEDYKENFVLNNGTPSYRFLMLWSGTYELSAGLDL
jgi:hypothetical protein